ncbi:MAG: type II secretion system minor pseudopilin GspI [Pseudomonadota bacterium]
MKRVRGFTLVEVMVALVIVAVGLSALITTAVRVLGDSYAYRDRALALYVGLNVVTEFRLRDELPELRETEDEIEFADRDWLYTARVIETDVENLRRIEVDVALADEPDVVIRSVLGFVGSPRQGDEANALWINQSSGQSFDGPGRDRNRDEPADPDPDPPEDDEP